MHASSNKVGFCSIYSDGSSSVCSKPHPFSDILDLKQQHLPDSIFNIILRDVYFKRLCFWFLWHGLLSIVEYISHILRHSGSTTTTSSRHWSQKTAEEHLRQRLPWSEDEKRASFEGYFLRAISHWEADITLRGLWCNPYFLYKQLKSYFWFQTT